MTEKNVAYWIDTRLSALRDYELRLNQTLQEVPNSEKLLNLKRSWENREYRDDWAWYEDEKANRKADRKVKKRKLQAHVKFHENLDERLDVKKLFDESVSSSTLNQEEEDEDGASSSVSEKAINRQDENLTSNADNKENENGNEIEEIEGEAEEVITDFLGSAVECSKTSKDICSVYKKEQNSDEDLIDLRLCSSFLRRLPRLIATSYLSEMDKITESLIPDNVHQFLVQFFSQNISDDEWQIKVDDLRSPEQNDPLMTALVRILRRTLPQFIKAFSLEAQNPLLNIATIEHAHLNAFVHPCLDSALWYLAKIHYEYGEIPSRNHINRNRADGVGFMTNFDKFQLMYFEGLRPVEKKPEKEIKDAKKIAHNLKNIYSKIVKEVIKNRRRLPKKLYIFGGQSFRLRLHLYFLDYCGKYRLNEVDNANLPREFSEMQDFLLAQDVIKSFIEARSEQRPSRLSYANALLQLDE
ncbi:hypothetical protein Glove_113g63 [Diversispora epigaea]|uniref:Uncharacterized protein n=1 Tax=Diversispora epigaea TaxID=1348612 RepID=A0A397JBN4_9GLOM|nr:hypothetical protein Glove_113g63 [Diversispora epigaea]